MLSLYKIVNDKLVFVGRAKHRQTVDRFVRSWKQPDCRSTTLVLFAVPTAENPDGFVSHFVKRNTINLRLVG